MMAILPNTAPLRPLVTFATSAFPAKWFRRTISKPVKWHRAEFRLYWSWKSRSRGGRPRIAEEIRVLIRRLTQENPDWGAPRIHGELQKLGFVLSERTIARYLRRIQRRGDPGQKWLAFLRNHREAIVAFDLFTVLRRRFECCTAFL